MILVDGLNGFRILERLVDSTILPFMLDMINQPLVGPHQERSTRGVVIAAFRPK